MSPPSAWMAGRIASMVVLIFSSSTPTPEPGGVHGRTPTRAATNLTALNHDGLTRVPDGSPVRCLAMPFLRATAGRLALAMAGLGAWLVLTATPASAHTAQGGSLPAPPWLLAYAGVAVLLIKIGR